MTLVQSKKCGIGRWVGVSRLSTALTAGLPEFEPCLKESSLERMMLKLMLKLLFSFFPISSVFLEDHE